MSDKPTDYGYTLAHLSQVYRKSIGLTIRRRRKERSLTLKALALHCEVTIYTVRSWVYYGVVPETKNLIKLDKLFK